MVSLETAPVTFVVKLVYQVCKMARIGRSVMVKGGEAAKLVALV